MKEHKHRWHWHELLWGFLLLAFAGLAFLSGTAAMEEHERRATVLSMGAAAAAVLTLAAGVFIKRRGWLEHESVRRIQIAGLAIVAVFIASLLIRSDYSLTKKDIRQYASGEQKYDATTQPGNELLQKLEKAVDKDTLTFSVYDVCVGKVSHRVLRDGDVSPDKVEITNRQVLTEKIKADAQELGADVVGITDLDPRFVFTKDNDGNPVQLRHKYAIVIGKGLDYRLASPSAPLPWQEQYSSIPEEIAAALSGRQVQTNRSVSPEAVNEMRDTLEFFQDGGRIAVQLAAEIRALGYPARAHFGRWSEVQVIPVAVEAGLGEVGKQGMLINKKFGPRGSLPIVTTDLPLVADRQVDMGVQEFCRTCNKCARACPVQAIPAGSPVTINGVSKWPVDGQKCWSFIKDNPKCMACMGACPFNKKDLLIHRLASWLITRKSLVANWLLVRMDDVLGYGHSAFVFKQNYADAAAKALQSAEQPGPSTTKAAGGNQR